MNMQEIMRQAQRMQTKIKKMQDELASRLYEGSAGGGMVVVTVSGAQELKSVKIEPEVVNPDDVEMLQDLIVAATNQAMAKAEESKSEEMAKLTGGMGLPGMPGLF